MLLGEGRDVVRVGHPGVGQPHREAVLVLGVVRSGSRSARGRRRSPCRRRRSSGSGSATCSRSAVTGAPATGWSVSASMTVAMIVDLPAMAPIAGGATSVGLLSRRGPWPACGRDRDGHLLVVHVRLGLAEGGVVNVRHVGVDLVGHRCRRLCCAVAGIVPGRAAAHQADVVVGHAVGAVELGGRPAWWPSSRPWRCPGRSWSGRAPARCPRPRSPG